MPERDRRQPALASTAWGSALCAEAERWLPNDEPSDSIADGVALLVSA